MTDLFQSLILLNLPSIFVVCYRALILSFAYLLEECIFVTYLSRSFEMDEEVKLRTRLRGKVTKLTNDLRQYRLSQDVDQDDLAYKVHALD